MTDERVVLLDDAGRATGTELKSRVHHADTPLHLAFSLHLHDGAGRVLLTRRAPGKTFGGIWTNAVCGHPAPGEEVEAAVHRRAMAELGVGVGDLRLVLPRFGYRAKMDGVVEHERCPVYVARLAPDGHVAPDPSETSDTRWLPWPDLVDRAADPGSGLSPWCVDQVALLTRLGPDPGSWPTGDPEDLPPAARPSGR